MIIGEDFNKKGKELLKHLNELSKEDSDVKIEVKTLNQKLHFDKSEIKNLLEYLEDKECVKIATIGGPFLYGHVTITPKGIAKVAKK